MMRYITCRGIATVVLAVGTSAVCVGCGPKGTTFRVVDFRAAGHEEAYIQGFAECYYCLDAHGHLELVAREASVSDEGLVTTQVVHVKTFWNTKPGRTGVDRTMINATVSYLILTGPIGASFEGSGFISYRERSRKTKLTGDLELSSLSPTRRLGHANRLFERAELSGEFVATRDRGKVVSIVNEMRRHFGPMPKYKVSKTAPEF